MVNAQFADSGGVGGHVEPAPVLTARGRHALPGGQVLDGTRHAGGRGDVDLQVARDVVQVGVRERCRHGPHRALRGRLRVVDAPVNSGFGETAAGVTEEGRLAPLDLGLLPPQQRDAESGCKQTGVSSSGRASVCSACARL